MGRRGVGKNRLNRPLTKGESAFRDQTRCMFTGTTPRSARGQRKSGSWAGPQGATDVKSPRPVREGKEKDIGPNGGSKKKKTRCKSYKHNPAMNRGTKQESPYSAKTATKTQRGKKAQSKATEKKYNNQGHKAADEKKWTGGSSKSKRGMLCRGRQRQVGQGTVDKNNMGVGGQMGQGASTWGRHSTNKGTESNRVKGVGTHRRRQRTATVTTSGQQKNPKM